MRRLFCIISLLFINAYILATRFDGFTNLAVSPPERNPLFSTRLDLAKSGTFFWKVPKDKLAFLGTRAQLSLAINLHMLRELPRDRAQVELRGRLAAYGIRSDGSKPNRLIIDDYYNTDEPFEAGVHLGETWGSGILEYALGAVQIHPGEDLSIEFSVTTPDPRLAPGNPRLKLVQEHDYAGLTLKYWFLGKLADICMVISLVLVLGLVMVGWRNQNQAKGKTVACGL
jgi:hypothetical protein